MASENSCRSTCTERSPCIRTLAMLNEDQANKTQCHQQMHDNYDLFQHLQLPAARQIAPNSSALREAPPTSPHRYPACRTTRLHLPPLHCRRKGVAHLLRPRHFPLPVARGSPRALPGLARGRGQPGPDRPDRLVSHDCASKSSNTQLVDHATQLPCDNLQRLACLALRPGLPTHSTGTRPHD